MKNLVIVMLAVVLLGAAAAWAQDPGCQERVLIGIAGDIDMDFDVDLDDFVVLKLAFAIEPPFEYQWQSGDFNGDGLLNLDDFVLLKKNFGGTYDWQTELPDLDCDGDRDLDDLALGMDIYGEYVCNPCWPDEPAANVPEPATMGLLALGGMAILRRRRP